MRYGATVLVLEQVFDQVRPGLSDAQRISISADQLSGTRIGAKAPKTQPISFDRASVTNDTRVGQALLPSKMERKQSTAVDVRYT